MTGKQYANIVRKRLGLTIVGAARYFGCSGRQSQKYAAGTPVPPLLRKVIQLLLNGKIKLEDLL